MKISLNWLRTLLETNQSAERIATLLTGSGLEVEGREMAEAVPGGLKGLVVGEVVECVKHPDADRLSLTKVNTGNGSLLSIVCGAPNVAAGQKVIVATVGTRLFPVSGEPFEIKKSKIRGQLSEGMICAEDEIGIGASHAGIIVLPPETGVGMPAAELYKIENDEILEIGLTPNRSDATSHYGVARDLAAVLNSQEHVHTYAAKIPGLHPLLEPAEAVRVNIEVKDREACPRYCGVVISGVKVEESPAWLQSRLKSIGLRPLNNIVDITNFVMHELGQPLHAFDFDRISGGKIIVRKAAAGEKFVTLDGVERALAADDLMICDEKAPMCIAGVLGGAGSGVTGATTRIFIESAFFNPSTVRRSARRHGIKTDAAFRFERGADPEMTIPALVRAANLVLETAGGSVSSEVKDIYPEKLLPYKVAFSYRNCSDLIGKDMDRAAVKQIILNLGMEIESEGTDGLLLHVPRYRYDVTREADVIEEVMRLYGYDQVEPSRHISYGVPALADSTQQRLEEKVSQLLASSGFSEIMALSLTRAGNYEQRDKLVKVLNPLSSDLDVLRADMVHGGLEAISHNLNRQAQDLRLFEHGRIYLKGADGAYEEKKQLGIFVTGGLFRENPYGLNRKADFAYLKSVLGALFDISGLTRVKSADSLSPLLAYGLSFTHNGSQVAEAGLVDAKLAKRFDIKQEVFYARVEWDLLVRAYAAQKISFAEPGRFPSVRRDLALLLDKSVRYSQVEELAFATEKKLLSDVNLFDIYEDEKLGGRKSYAVSFTLRDREGTLTDKQIDGVMEKLIRNYREKLGAELR